MTEPKADVRSTSFDFDNMDWNEYEVHRPAYPKALYDLLYEHHSANGGESSWNLAVDVGAGGGTVTRVLLHDFKHVVWSDASATYVEQAQKRFAKEAAAGKITFLQRKFDEFDPARDFPKEHGLADMITAGTCIHFSDADKLMAQLAPMLRSGGTVAAFCYGASPVLPPGDPAGPLIFQVKNKIITWADQNIVSLKSMPAIGTSQARYDNVDFDPATWKNVRRIQSLRNERQYAEWIDPAASRTRSSESIETVQDDFFTRTVDYEWLVGYFRNFMPGFPVMDQIQDELRELETALAGRKVLARWALILIMATKR